MQCFLVVSFFFKSLRALKYSITLAVKIMNTHRERAFFSGYFRSDYLC